MRIIVHGLKTRTILSANVEPCCSKVLYDRSSKHNPEVLAIVISPTFTNVQCRALLTYPSAMARAPKGTALEL